MTSGDMTPKPSHPMLPETNPVGRIAELLDARAGTLAANERLVRGLHQAYGETLLALTFREDTCAYLDKRAFVRYGTTGGHMKSTIPKMPYYIGGLLAVHASLPSQGEERKRFLDSEARPALAARMIGPAVSTDDIQTYEASLERHFNVLPPALVRQVDTASILASTYTPLGRIEQEFRLGYTAMHRSMADMWFEHALATTRPRP